MKKGQGLLVVEEVEVEVVGVIEEVEVLDASPEGWLDTAVGWWGSLQGENVEIALHVVSQHFPSMLIFLPLGIQAACWRLRGWAQPTEYLFLRPFD